MSLQHNYRASQGHGALPEQQNNLWLTGLLWLLIMLMIVPEGFDYASLSLDVASGPPETGSPGSRLTWLVILGLSAFIVAWRANLAIAVLRSVNPFLLLLIAVAMMSMVWTIDAPLTFRRLVRLITIVLACLAFVVVGWHQGRLQQLLRPILTMVLAGSVVFGLLAPGLAIHQEQAPELAGAWRGLTNHKNSLGGLASITLILWFHAILAREVKLLPALGGAALAIVCLLLSRSATSLMSAITVMLMLMMLLRSPRGMRPLIPYIVGVAVVVLITYSLAILRLIPGMGILMAPITALTGKDMTLTGRTEIWQIITDNISTNPLLGSGYGAYWSGPIIGSPSYEFIVRMGQFYPGSAHNGYLEVANDLGWIGLMLLIAYILTHARQSLRLFSTRRNQAALYLALFFQQAITNLSETHFFSVLSVQFVIMTLATTALARDLFEERLRLSRGYGPFPGSSTGAAARNFDPTYASSRTAAAGAAGRGAGR